MRDKIEEMQRIADALGEELLGAPMPKMGIGRPATAPGPDPGEEGAAPSSPASAADSPAG